MKHRFDQCYQCGCDDEALPVSSQGSSSAPVEKTKEKPGRKGGRPRTRREQESVENDIGCIGGQQY